MRRIDARPLAKLLLIAGMTTCLASTTVPVALGQDGGIKGVKGTVVEPRMVDAKVKNCQISAPGKYQVEVGSLIQLGYMYPVAMAPPSSATPKEVGLTFLGTPPLSVVESPLGIRQVRVPGLAGGAQLRAYLVAERPGPATVSFTIDKDVYEYTFEVIKN